MRDKGYLTLNPFRYTNLFLSIILPIFFLVIGGIGLPGGAVYINMAAIRRPAVRSLVSAAGPIASALCAVVLIIPFLFDLVSVVEMQVHESFWAGWAFLGFLQITSIMINMLPIPGLDGFGILEPYLGGQLSQAIRPFGFLILFFLLFWDTPIRDFFWQQVSQVNAMVSFEFLELAIRGLELFRFWN